MTTASLEPEQFAGQSLSNNGIISRKNWTLILTAFALYVVVGFYFLDKYPLIYGDEAYYNEPPIQFLKSRTFRTDLFPPLGGFDVSNLINGRIFAFIQVFVFSIFGQSVITLRLQSFVAGLLSILLIYASAHSLFKNKRAAVFTSGVFALSHLLIFASHFGRPDMTVCLFALASFTLFLQALKSDKAWQFLLSGMLAALCVDVHPPGNVAIFIMWAAAMQQYFAKKIQFKSLCYVGVGITLGILWWLSLHVFPDPALFINQRPLTAVSQVNSLLGNPINQLLLEFHRWKSFFWYGAFHRNMFLLLLLSLSAIYGILHRSQTAYPLLIAAIVGGFLGYTISAPNKTVWYIIYIYPFFILLIVPTLYAAACSQTRWMRTCGLALGLIYALFLASENYYKLPFYRSNYNAFMEKVRQVLPKNSTVLALESYWFGLKDHVKFRMSMNTVGFKYIMPQHGIGLDYYAGSLEDFLRRNHIDYIIADPEIVSTAWSAVDITNLITEKCDFVGEVTDEFYGTSIYIARKSPAPITTKIYKIKQ